MSLHRCSQCPRLTNGERAICYHCEVAARPKKRKAGVREQRRSLSPAAIEAWIERNYQAIRRQRSISE